jgi:predicted transcriptional regulator
MAEENTTARVDPQLVAQIVGSYVRHHKIGADQLAGLISVVGQSLAEVSHVAPPAEEARVPAVPIRRSVQRDYVVCLECGFRGKQLRRHLTTRHGLDADAYRTRWQLAADHPLVAPSYSERRSGLARQFGLGRSATVASASDAGAPAAASENGSPGSGEAAEPDPALAVAAAALPPPRRRGRSRRSQAME